MPYAKRLIVQSARRNAENAPLNCSTEPCSESRLPVATVLFASCHFLTRATSQRINHAVAKSFVLCALMAFKKEHMTRKVPFHSPPQLPKKSSRVTCGGAKTKQSTSASGVCTPSRYDPNDSKLGAAVIPLSDTSLERS